MQYTIHADFANTIGAVRPMHAINNAPFSGCRDDMFPQLTAAGIPYARLHDTGGRYGGGVFVDIDNIFRDPAADPQDPAAYDFAFTDWLLAALHKAGVQPFYRLGASIENDHRIRAYHIYPPRDARHWAEVCDGIIRHYNEGWANGFYYGIRYWEIWNEPDNQPFVEDNPMWKGTMEEYFQLYTVTANLLKARHPDLMIGGYASCGFYSILNAHVGVANSSTRTDYFITFFDAFLDYITDPAHPAPLDFFSWHSYSGIEENIRYAAYAREKLDARGLQATQSILNEWNPGIQNRGKLVDAALIGGMMVALHRAGVDMLMYYDGQINAYNGLWDPITHAPFAAYYTFTAFDALYRLGTAVQSDADADRLRVLAAAANGRGALLAVNNTGAALEVRLALENLPADGVRVRYIDAEHTLADPPLRFAALPATLPLAADGLLLLEAGCEA